MPLKRVSVLSKKEKKQVKSIARRVAKRVSEPKEHHKTLTATQLSTSQTATSNMVLLNAIGQGDTNASRDGDQIYATGLEYNLQFSQPTAANNNCVVRAMIVSTDNDYTLWDQDRPTPAGIVRDDFKSRINRIYMDRVFAMNKPVAGETQFKVMKGFISLKGHKVEYEDSSVSAVKNRLYLLLITDEGTHPPTAFGAFKYVFRDP